MPLNTTSQRALDTFLAAFTYKLEGGASHDREQVKQEIIQYWQDQGKLGHPEELFRHMMDKRVAEGLIARERADILTKTFSDSFAPEHSTGFHAKHREPLVEALAQTYVDAVKPKGRIWRIEGDISNLGGLNKAMQASAEALRTEDRKAYDAMLAERGIEAQDPQATFKLGRDMADKVLFTICNITKDHLSKVADVTAVRKGGDEISFIAELNKDVSAQHLRAAIKETQTDVAQFVISTGLIIPHDKYPGNRRRSGVGIGLHEVDMSMHSPEAQQQAMAQGISTSKEGFQALLHRNEQMEIAVPDMKQLADMLNVFPAPEKINRTLKLGSVKRSILPADERRQIELVDKLKATGRYDLNQQEYNAAAAVHALVRRNDFVTKLPLFENMQDELFPAFIQKFRDRGDSIKLVNIEFSHLGGGNELSEDTGNAMLRSFRDITLKAMSKSGLLEYNDGLAVRPGGKFTLLVPSDTPMDAFASMALNLRQGLDDAKDKPLVLTPHEQQEVLSKLASSEKLQKWYGPQGEKLKDGAGNLRITMADIVHPKTGLAGPEVIMVFSKDPINLSAPLGESLKPLEEEAEKRQKQITTLKSSPGFVERLAMLRAQENGITR